MLRAGQVVVVLGFYVSPTAKVIQRRDLGLKSHLKDEKPGIELTTPGLEGKWLNHYTTEASMCRSGAGAPSTSVRSPPGSWLAARMAALTWDFHTSLSQGSTSLSFHSRRPLSVSVLYVILGFSCPPFPSICK